MVNLLWDILVSTTLTTLCPAVQGVGKIVAGGGRNVNEVINNRGALPMIPSSGEGEVHSNRRANWGLEYKIKQDTEVGYVAIKTKN